MLRSKSYLEEEKNTEHLITDLDCKPTYPNRTNTIVVTVNNLPFDLFASPTKPYTTQKTGTDVLVLTV